MQSYITILFILLTASSIAQSERVVMLDSSIGNYGTCYLLVVGQTIDGEKVGDWNLFQYSSVDTNKFLASSETYENGSLTVIKEFKLDGYSQRKFDKKGNLKSKATYRYGNIVSETEFLSRKKAITRSYYPNGQVSGEGPEVLVKIVTGCDAGMMMFQRVGKWMYYDTNGEELDPQVYELNENVFKKL